MKWYYSPDGSQRHEVGDEELAALVRDGRLLGSMLLWREGMDGWRPARDVRPDLFGGAAAEVPPAFGGSAGSTPPSAQSGPVFSSPGVPTMVPHRPTDSGALISVVSGAIALLGPVTGVCCCFGPLVSPIAAIVAIVYGHAVYGKGKGHPEAESDRNLALVGLILGYLSLLVTLGYIIYMVAVAGIAGMGAMNGGFQELPGWKP